MFTFFSANDDADAAAAVSFAPFLTFAAFFEAFSDAAANVFAAASRKPSRGSPFGRWYEAGTCERAVLGGGGNGSAATGRGGGLTDDGPCVGKGGGGGGVLLRLLDPNESRRRLYWKSRSWLWERDRERYSRSRLRERVLDLDLERDLDLDRDMERS